MFNRASVALVRDPPPPVAACKNSCSAAAVFICDVLGEVRAVRLFYNADTTVTI